MGDGKKNKRKTGLLLPSFLPSFMMDIAMEVGLEQKKNLNKKERSGQLSPTTSNFSLFFNFI